jgi:hypothetical protein
VLLGEAQWSGAYYLAGYAVECALKACIGRSFKKYHMPELRVIKESHTHDLNELVRIAELKPQLDALAGTDRHFQLNWTVVKDWKETSRYAIWSEDEARDLYQAITQRGHGVFRWAKQHW